jgi:AraC-like DNA-binding protein
VALIRGTSLLSYPELVRELGADPEQLLQLAGVPPEAAGDHEAFISYRSLVVAVESAAQVTATPDFGRRLAARQGIQILGPVGVAARTAATMGDALRILTVYLSAYSPSISASLEPLADPDRTFFEFRTDARDIPPAPQTVELSLGVVLETFRFLRGDHYQPLRVHLPHRPLTDIESYWDYFNCKPRFTQPSAGFTIRTADLAQPLSGDSHAHELILRYLDNIVSEHEPTFSAPVARLVRQLLPTGMVSLNRVARQFSLHPKTFQRRLAEDGTTFSSLVEETRRGLLEHYLRDTDLNLTQVARELGYAEQSVLTHSCNRWYHSGPAALRTRLRAAT